MSGRTFAFGEVESGDEAIAPVVEGETACNGDGDGSGDNGDMDVDGTTSGGNIDSIQVEVARLAGESQRMCYSRRKRIKYSPVSSKPPIHPTDCPYGPVRWRRRRGRIKFIPTKVSQSQKDEMTYLGCTEIAQPPANDSERLFRVIGPCHQCDRIEIASVKVKIECISANQTQEVKTTHQIRTSVAQPCRNAPDH